MSKVLTSWSVEITWNVTELIIPSVTAHKVAEAPVTIIGQ